MLIRKIKSRLNSLLSAYIKLPMPALHRTSSVPTQTNQTECNSMHILTSFAQLIVLIAKYMAKLYYIKDSMYAESKKYWWKSMLYSLQSICYCFWVFCSLKASKKRHMLEQAIYKLFSQWTPVFSISVHTDTELRPYAFVYLYVCYWCQLKFCIEQRTGWLRYEKNPGKHVIQSKIASWICPNTAYIVCWSVTQHPHSKSR